MEYLYDVDCDEEKEEYESCENWKIILTMWNTYKNHI